MSRRIDRPVTQVRYTNVVCVRLTRGKKRFEVGAYPNKTQQWRDGLERDLGEVLQSETVFSNLQRGVAAKHKDLERAFGSTSHADVARVILAEGEVQVSELERRAKLDSLVHDIATIVSEKAVNPESNRRIPVNVILQAMADTHFAPNPKRSAKQQALQLVRDLAAHMPIARAKMQLRATVPAAAALGAVEAAAVEQHGAEVSARGESSLDLLVDPARFRALDQLAREHGGTLEVVTLAVHEQDEVGISDETERRAALAGGAGAGAAGAVGEGAAAAAAAVVAAASGAGIVMPPTAPPRGSAAASGDAALLPAGAEAPPPRRGRGLACTTCGGAFESRDEHRAHFKSEWHRTNLQRKLKDQPPLSEAEYAEEEAVSVLS